MKKKHIAIYDTTLRDGAQAEGIAFSAAGKLRLAKRLDAFGLDYIEGGYAYISNGLNNGDIVLTTRLIDPLENALLKIVEKKDGDNNS